jgi:hypothetical protein
MPFFRDYGYEKKKLPGYLQIEQNIYHNLRTDRFQPDLTDIAGLFF